MPLISSLGVMNAINFGMASSATSVKKQSLAMFTAGSPYITAYPVNSTDGYGTKYANPATTPSGQAMNGCFSMDNSVIASALYNSPYVIAYPFTIASGFGTKYANPSSALSSICNDCAFTPTKSHLVVANNSSSVGLYAYDWSNGFGTRTSAGTQPPGAVNSVDVSPANTSLVITHNNSPYIAAYAWSNGFGAKYANPSPGYSIGVNDAKYSSDGSSVGFGIYSSPWLVVLAFSSGFGTKFSNPSSLPAVNQNITKVAFSPDGKYIAGFGRDTYGSYLTIYNWDNISGFGSKVVDGVGAGPIASGLAFDATSKMFAISGSGSPYLKTYKIAGLSQFSTPVDVNVDGNITFTN